MKKTIVFILLCLTVVLTTGGYFFHKIHLISYKKDFKAFIKLNKCSLSTTQLSINKSDLYVNTKELIWEDDNKEVLYKNELYDVLSITKSEQEVILSLLSDENEQNLKNEFASLYFNENIQKDSQKPITLLKQFFALKYLGSSTIELLYVKTLSTPYHFMELNFLINKVFLSQDTPPPNFS